MKYFNIDERFCRYNYNMYEHRYNANTKHSRDQLKPEHRSYYFLLVHEYYIHNLQQKTNGVEMTNFTSLKLPTNSIHMGALIERDPRTIRSYNARLIKAGILSKVYHGQTRNYDLYFNPYLMPVFDQNDPLAIPEIYKSTPQLSSFADTSIRKPCPSLKALHKTYINKLIDKESLKNENSENSVGAIKADFESTFIHNDLDFLNLIMCFGYEYAKTALKTVSVDDNTGIEGKPAETKKDTCGEILPIDLPAKKPRKIDIMRKVEEKEISLYRALKSDNIDDLKLIYAHILLSYSLDKIPTWKERVYPGVLEEITIYIAENYLADCQTKADIQRKMNIFYSTIDISRKYIRKKLSSGAWTSFFIFPPTFFNVNYKNGFANFMAKAIENSKLDDKQRLEKSRLETNRKINIILEEYYTRPTEDNYRELLARVQNTIPGREKQFISCIKHKNHKIEKVWDKKYIRSNSKTA